MSVRTAARMVATAATAAGLLLLTTEAVCDMERLAAVPEGYYLHYLDDCGVAGRHPHTTADGEATFSPSDVEGDERARTVSFCWKTIPVVYEGLDPARPYILAVTYANERFNDRVQTLSAGDVVLHGPRALPKGGAERLLYRVPAEAVTGGTLLLSIGLESGPNAVVSCVELWTDTPAAPALRISGVTGLYGPMVGTVLDATYGATAGARVSLRVRGEAAARAAVVTGPDGRFSFDRALVELVAREGDAELAASDGRVSDTLIVPREELAFEPVRYTPLPSAVAGLPEHVRCLDGEWRLRLDAAESAWRGALTAEGWCPVRIPGQWAQQGYEVDPAKPAAVATEFTVPEDWAGRRVMIRFDGVCGAVDYRVNGHDVGHSERQFTPVEWDITRAVRYGATNRLDLTMLAGSLSERLSYGSGYAFHSLGGVHRSVRVYAVPETHLAALRLDAGLDDQYRDGVLDLQLAIEAARGGTGELSLDVDLGGDARGAPSRFDLGRVGAGRLERDLRIAVPGPRQWSAEKPNLYTLRLTLSEDGQPLETVERAIGFRRIEVKGSQLLVNGRAVKLAGACRHEIDPLTGRADTARHAETDVRLMKAANLNTIRTAHYPPTQELLDAADRIGMYVEVEAPFCWVGSDGDPAHLRAFLDPTSAMVDYHHSHPSVLLWSIANESTFNPLFEVSAQLVHDLDPTRPRTFNNPDPKRLLEVANLHYPGPPYDEQLPGDPRPILLGEYNFPICHEQTDVRLDPGLRELWGAGHADPDSEWGRDCAASFGGPFMQPGMRSGTWDDMLASERVLGGDIWAAFDDTFYLPGGKSVGYSWHHGFWGLIDAWRRPKPEWWLSKMIYSPIRFPDRTLPLAAGQRELRVPVRNRYSFTDLSELGLSWQLGEAHGALHADLAPWQDGELTVPLPATAAAGDELMLRVTGPGGDLVTAVAITLGERRREPLPPADAGAPTFREEDGRIAVEGEGFAFQLDTRTGAILSHGADRVRVRALPMPHATRFDFGDLAGPNAIPYAVLPDATTRVIEKAEVREVDGALEITLHERYASFAGTTCWRIDRAGVGRIRYDYTYTGDDAPFRELGVRVLLDRVCESLSWRRWSEWGDCYPEDSISRTRGEAEAHRDPALGPSGHRVPPSWPWSLDETEQGTADFRSVKLNVYEALLAAPDGRGLGVHADADAHVRAALAPEGTWLHILSTCRLGPVTLHTGDHLEGEFAVDLVQ